MQPARQAEPVLPTPAEPANAEPPSTPDPAPAPGWQRRLDRLIGRVTAIPIVRLGLSVMDAANEAAVPLFSMALAFSTLFALIPLLLLLAGVIGWLVGDPAARDELLAQLISYFPPLADLLEQTLDSLIQQRGALSVIGLIGLLWGASSFYGALDEIMRRIFPGGGVRDQVWRRIRGLLAILIVVGLIVVTVSLSTLWAFLDQVVSDLGMWRWVTPVVGLSIVILVVWFTYLVVPTKPPSWRAALPPAILGGIGIGLLTSLFTVLTPWLVGALSGIGVLATFFGALVWLNFSFQILLYMAAWARVRRDHEEIRRGVVG